MQNVACQRDSVSYTANHKNHFIVIDLGDANFTILAILYTLWQCSLKQYVYFICSSWDFYVKYDISKLPSIYSCQMNVLE